MKPANPEPANSEHDKAPVLIVVDTENYSPATIQLAVEIAASLQTGLRGLFIENENLLRVAELPFSREITSTSGDRPLNVAVIQRSMRAMANQFKEYLAQTAQASQVHWSYHYICGSVDKIGADYGQDAICTIVGKTVFRQSISRRYRRIFKVLIIDNDSLHLNNTLQTLLRKFEGEEVEVMLVSEQKSPKVPTASLLQDARQKLVRFSVIELEKNQLAAFLAGAGNTFDYAIVSRHEPTDSLRAILNNTLCPVITVS